MRWDEIRWWVFNRRNEPLSILTKFYKLPFGTENRLRISHRALLILRSPHSDKVSLGMVCHWSQFMTNKLWIILQNRAARLITFSVFYMAAHVHVCVFISSIIYTYVHCQNKTDHEVMNRRYECGKGIKDMPKQLQPLT